MRKVTLHLLLRWAKHRERHFESRLQFTQNLLILGQSSTISLQQEITLTTTALTDDSVCVSVKEANGSCI